ncbi:MAG: alanine/ornithine racemase family PLP-dependent enzyme [Clostridiales bacterium]|nr:alanine/ornithine racemase family PLP-dependent enzyme [Clostridiales bacterium]
MGKNAYPQLEINLKKLESNVKEILARCSKQGVEVAGVIKGFNGLLECAEVFASSGCKFIASSRLEQLEAVKNAKFGLPLMLIRVPMPSEAAEAVRLADISLNSEIEVLRALNGEAEKQGKVHEVILMVDLGDLREGFWEKSELLEAALLCENELKGLKLSGIGTNLGCYGSVSATVEKMEELISCAEMIEAKIGRELEYISGGATTSLIRIVDSDMPARINQLRVGEGIILGRDLQELWGYDMSYLHTDVFTLKAQVIEVRDKPSHPVGEIMFDAFGNRPVYEDKGIRRKALLGVGKLDYAFPDKIYPRDKGIEVLGASSDHTILDIEKADKDIKLGDILEFDVCYASLIYATSSANVKIVMAYD